LKLIAQHVLLVKLRYIGDTLSLLPVIENLKRKAPRVFIDVMVNKGTEAVLVHHPAVHKVWPSGSFLYGSHRSERGEGEDRHLAEPWSKRVGAFAEILKQA
jgi:ADP-heptose:LPS heptosyltransferase